MDVLLFPVLEGIRRLLEERDAVQMAAVSDFQKLSKIRSPRERLKVEHFVRNCINHIIHVNTQISALFADSSESIGREREQLDAQSDLSVFYGMVKQLKEYHKRLPGEPADTQAVQRLVDGLRLSDEQLDLMFSGEEAFGRFLDLNSIYLMYTNYDFVGSMDYLGYMKRLGDFSDIAVQQRISNSAEYAKYLQELVSYLEDFISRSMPLLVVREEDYAGKTPAEWAAEYERVAETKFDEDNYCPHCDKLFINPNSYESHLRGKGHQKNALVAPKDTKTSQELHSLFDSLIREKKERLDMVVRLELKVKHLCHLLEHQRSATAANIERKQALTPEELAEEEAREQARLALAQQQKTADDRSFLEKDMDGGVYNPLKLPLDWDGKPIPLWLWKLHGLGTKFPCEICGNFVYLGRKAFDQHFFEWRHAHGMKCLGVPNTRHFFQITRIDEVLGLWEEMKKNAPSTAVPAAALAASASVTEEIEDSHGNVYSKRVYEDMRRQGLI